MAEIRTGGRYYRKLTVIILAVVLILIAYFIYMKRNQFGVAIMPFIIGGVIAYLLNPLVVKLQQRRLPRWVAIVLIYLLFLIIVGLSLCYFIPVLYSNISELISNIPIYAQEYTQRFNNMQSAISYSPLPQQVKDIVISQIHSNVSAIQGLFLTFLRNSLGAINSVFALFVNFILGMIIAFYLLKDKDYFKEHLTLLVPRRWRGAATSTMGEINLIISNFIQGQLLIASVVAVLEITGLSIIGLKYAFVLGLIGGFANIIPYFGPFIGAVPAIAIALLYSPIKALLVITVFIIVQQIDNAFITPRIMSEKIGLHPLLIIFVVLLGGSLFGIMGLILAVPITAIIKVIGWKVVEKIV